MCMHMHNHTHAHAHAHACTHTYIHTYTHTHAYTHTHHSLRYSIDIDTIALKDNTSQVCGERSSWSPVKKNTSGGEMSQLQICGRGQVNWREGERERERGGWER